MECYITYSVKGFLAFNNENELIFEKLFPEDEIINKLTKINNKNKFNKYILFKNFIKKI